MPALRSLLWGPPIFFLLHFAGLVLVSTAESATSACRKWSEEVANLRTSSERQAETLTRFTRTLSITLIRPASAQCSSLARTCTVVTDRSNLLFTND